MSNMEDEHRDLQHGPSLMDFMPERPKPESFVARAGSSRVLEPLDQVSETEVIEAIQTVYDPEIPVNIYDLGLIYDVNVDENNNVEVKMTLTTPNCPVAESLPMEVENTVKEVKEVNKVNLELVWDPPWDKSMITEAGKLELNL